MAIVQGANQKIPIKGIENVADNDLSTPQGTQQALMAVIKSSDTPEQKLEKFKSLCTDELRTFCDMMGWMFKAAFEDQAKMDTIFGKFIAEGSNDKVKNFEDLYSLARVPPDERKNVTPMRFVNVDGRWLMDLS
jgi:hypothetical protein